jgi:OmpA-OmpF porin, OOP family
MKAILLFAITLFAEITFAQNAKTTVHVIITDMKMKPLKAHQVLFSNNKGQWIVKSDSKGMGKVDLETGLTYNIKIRGMVDTIEYSNLEIPKLNPGEIFEEPLTVRIQFEPGRKFTLDNVQFETGKAILQASSYAELNEIVDYMKINDKEIIEIAGHTDNVGQDADNLKLSQSRAEAVKNYLVKKGIAAARLKAKGYGASQPVADNSNEEGRQKNRRTEVRLVGNN